MALTTEQQTSHLSRLQQEVLTWDYYRMGGEDDAGASSGRTLREVPYTFAGITEYLDVFEPLVLEECAAQLVRGDEEDVHPSTIGAVFRSERREGFHVVQFILGEEAMSEFHDNDLILVSKTDPAADQNEHDDDKGDDKGDKDGRDEAKDDAEEDAADAEDGLRRVYALGYVDGRDSRNMMRVRFYLPEPAAKVTGNTAHKGALGEEDYARFRAVRNALSSPRGAWYLMHLANMSTIAREWLALHAFPALPFAHAILSGKPSNAPAHSSWELPAALQKSMHAAYNESQLTALRAALEKQPITLIQGPPGTGKTRIILSLLSVILHAVPGASSGHELDLKRYLESREERKPLAPSENAAAHRRVMPWLVGASNPRDAPPLPRDAPRPAPPPAEKAEIVGEESYRRTKVLVCAPSNSALDEIVLRIMQSGLLGPSGASYSPTLVRVGVNVHHSVEAVSMESLVRERVGATDDAGAASAEKKFERALERDRVKLAILDEAAVVCSTLSFSGSGMFARMTRQFDVVVIDEAAQAVEPSTLVPLCYGAKQVFLVGDPRQLPATVLSAVATEHGYNQSMFKRLERCGYPVHLLKTQYRMHPSIREFPSTQFYAGELEDGPRMAAKTRRDWHKNPLFRPFVFMDVQGKEYQGNGVSWANDEEAAMVVALVRALVDGYPDLASGEKIGVISPYKAQVRNIRKRLTDALGAEKSKAVDVNSIDGFQGREKEVCVFSVVRAPTHGHGLGFVADERRINVGLTRARTSLVVVGSAKSLKGDKNWGGLVASARDRDLIMRPPGKDYAAFVRKHGATYDADDLSGSEDEADDAAAEEANDDDDEGAGYGGSVGVADGSGNFGGEPAGAHVHKPEWTLAGRGANDDTNVADARAGFTEGNVVDELVTEAPTRGGGNDDYGGGGGEDDDAPDPYAQEEEPAAKGKGRASGAKRARGATAAKAGTAAAKKAPAAKRTRGK